VTQLWWAWLRKHQKEQGYPRTHFAKGTKNGSNFMMKIFDKKIVNLERRVIAQIQRLKYCSLITPYCLRSSLIMIFFLVIIFHQSPFSLELFKIMKLMKTILECVHLIKLWFSNLDINNFGWKHTMVTPLYCHIIFFLGGHFELKPCQNYKRFSQCFCILW